MENTKLIGILVLILVGFFLMTNQRKRETMQEEEEQREGFGSFRSQEEFCPRGYCPEDQTKETNLKKTTAQQFPCYQKYKTMGYDNPYIYPYSYYWNQNHPVDKYKYPQWVRQLQKDLAQDQFPGYTYY